MLAQDPSFYVVAATFHIHFVEKFCRREFTCSMRKIIVGGSMMVKHRMGLNLHRRDDVRSWCFEWVNLGAL